MRRTSFLAVPFLLVLLGMDVHARGFQTPKSTMETLIRAAKTMDAHLWFSCLSRTDIEVFDALYNPQVEKRLLETKKYLEEKQGKPLSNDMRELFAFQTVLDVGKYGIPEATHVLEERIWNDKYAEVTIVMALLAKGYLPPMTFSFLKENGQWKLSQWITTQTMLGWSAAQTPGMLDPLVNFAVKTHTNIEFNRGDCRNLKQRSFPLSAEDSAEFRRMWEDPKTRDRQGLLLLWAATGDPEAKGIVEQESLSDKQGRLRQGLREYDKMAAGLKPCGPQPETRGRKLPAPDSVEFWKIASDRDIIALRQCPARFPKERKICAQAQLRAAGILMSNESYEAAAKEYAGVVKTFPELQDEVVEAKSSLARLYWQKLGQQAKANELWKELSALGRLPPDAAFEAGKSVVPVTVIQDIEKTFRRGIFDFDVLDDGSILLLRLLDRKGPDGRPSPSGAQPRFDRHDSNGKFLKSLPDNGITEIPHAMYRNAAKLFLESYSKLIVLSNGGAVLGELVNQFKNFELKSELHNGVGGISHSEQFPQAIWTDAEMFWVLYWESLRGFDYQGALVRNITVPSCREWGNSKGRMVGNRRGDLVFTQPVKGNVFRVDSKGQLIPMRPPKLAEGSFSHIVHMFSDKEDNLYVIDRGSRRILKFGKGGEFIRSFEDESVTEPTGGAVDEKGNVYVVGYGAQGGDVVTVFDSKTSAVSRIRIPTMSLPNISNSNILDIEVSGNEIYMVVAQYVIKADRSGRILSRFQAKSSLRDFVRLAKNRQGNVFFCDGKGIWQYEGENSRLVVEFPARESNQYIASFAFDNQGGIYAYSHPEGVFFFDAQTKQITPLKGKYGSRLFSVRFMSVDREGRLYGTMSDIPEIKTISSDGETKTLISGKASGKQFWSPRDIALDAQNNIYVYDEANKALLKFQPDGAFVKEFSLAKHIGGWVNRIRIDGNGRLYVLSDERDDRRIVRFELRDMF
ncbi:MAG TPA: hypothetical protein DCM05_18305 [Elusimicrobia bacterium]|nr:hypothetical protein [Elusimicrobiota bacterium]